jgi:CTP:molybdopterin cytidylyltransferase MocA
VVVADLAAPVERQLAALLGEQGMAALRRELAARARRWAAAAAPDRAFEATSLDAAAVALHGHEGPVLLAAPDVPSLSAAHAAAAVADIAAGTLITIARTTDGHPFLVGLPRLDPDLLDLTADLFDWELDGMEVFGRVVLAAEAADAEVGMIATERRLASIGDARALLADPLAPAELVPLLAPAIGRGSA